MNRAMIFAAGLGRRMLPLTGHTPKALIPVGGKPMLLRVIDKLAAAGVVHMVINVHHHADQVREFIDRLDIPGLRFDISDESGELLDTGGGLKKAAALLGEDQAFFVYNADILSNIDLKDMAACHLRHRPLATLAVSPRRASRYFLWDSQGLAGWENAVNGQQILCEPPRREPLRALAFSGIHLIEPAIFGLLEEEGAFPIRDVYLRLGSEHRIIPYQHDNRLWADIGSLQKLRMAEEMIRDHPGMF